MFVSDSFGIQYGVRFFNLSVATSISPCIHGINGKKPILDIHTLTLKGTVYNRIKNRFFLPVLMLVLLAVFRRVIKFWRYWLNRCLPSLEKKKLNLTFFKTQLTIKQSRWINGKIVIFYPPLSLWWINEDISVTISLRSQLRKATMVSSASKFSSPRVCQHSKLKQFLQVCDLIVLFKSYCTYPSPALQQENSSPPFGML